MSEQQTPDQPFDQSADQPAGQSFDQPFEQSADQAADQSGTRFADVAIVQSADPSQLSAAGLVIAAARENLADRARADALERRTRRQLARQLDAGAGGSLARRFMRGLVAEQDLIGQQRDPAPHTHGETVVLGHGKARAETALARSGRPLERQTRRTEAVKARQARLRIQAGLRRTHRITHPDGGERTVAETLADQEAQRASINADIKAGSRRHDRVSRGFRQLPGLVAVLDFLLLLFFFAGITNVNWSMALSIELAFAIVLAVMTTGVSYGFLALAGRRMRCCKDDSGAIRFDELDRLAKVVTAAAVAAIAVLAVLMFVRMRAEVLDALGHRAGATAMIVPAALATVSVLANALVIVVHALDGSPEVDRLGALGAAVHSHLLAEHRQLAKGAVLDPTIDVLRRRTRRTAVTAVTAASRHRSAAETTIDLARAVHQGVGPHSEPTVNPNQESRVLGYRQADTSPQVDERALRQVREHVDSALPSAAELP